MQRNGKKLIYIRIQAIFLLLAGYHSNGAQVGDRNC